MVSKGEKEMSRSQYRAPSYAQEQQKQTEEFVNELINDVGEEQEQPILDEETNDKFEPDTEEGKETEHEEEVNTEVGTGLILGIKAEVNTDEGKRLNVRKEPSLDSEVITMLRKGEVITLQSDDIIDGFYKLHRRSGFVLAEFIDIRK